MKEKNELLSDTKELEADEVGQGADGHQNGDDGDIETAKVIALKYIKDTPRHKLPELSDIALDLQRTVTMIRLHVIDVTKLCLDIMEGQKRWYKNWAYWNLPTEAEYKAIKEKAKKGEILTYLEPVERKEWISVILPQIKKAKQSTKAFLAEHEDIRPVGIKKEREYKLKRSMPAIDLLKRYDRNIAEARRVKSEMVLWEKYVDDLITEKDHLLSDQFVYFYLQGRRSKDGMLLTKLIEVSRDQIASEGQSMNPEDLLSKMARDHS